MTINYSRRAEKEILKYFENYQTDYSSGYQQNDLSQRSNIYNRIAQILQQDLDQTYVDNNRNFIDIKNIGTIEYQIENNQNEIIVMNIQFSNQNVQSGNSQYKQPNQNINKWKNAKYDPIGTDQMGYTKVKWKNGNYYNYLDRFNRQIIYPDQWFTKVGDFFYSDGVTYATVEVDGVKKVLVLIPTYQLRDIQESVEKTIQMIITEHELKKSIDFMWRLLKVY